MTHLFLIRHGQTDWNIEGRWQGHADVPLNARGRQQADEVAVKLANAGLTAIYSSDLQRARVTAEALARQTGLRVQIDPRLREINQGVWQGMLVSEIRERYGEAYHSRRQNPLNVAPPGGETVAEVRQRVVAAVDDICKKHPQEFVAIVSHGFSLAVAQMHYRNLPVDQVWDLIPENDRWVELEVQPS